MPALRNAVYIYIYARARFTTATHGTQSPPSRHKTQNAFTYCHPITATGYFRCFPAQKQKHFTHYKKITIFYLASQKTSNKQIDCCNFSIYQNNNYKDTEILRILNSDLLS